MQLDFGKLSSTELKDLMLIAKEERERRGRKNPANHEPPLWVIPNKAVTKGKDAPATT